MTDFETVDYFTDQSLCPTPTRTSTTCGRSARCHPIPVQGAGRHRLLGSAARLQGLGFWRVSQWRVRSPVCRSSRTATTSAS